MTERLRGRALQRRNERILRRDSLCKRCEKDNRVSASVEVDHIVPLFKGGSDDDDNLQGLCSDCHVDKTREDMGFGPRPRIGADGWPEGVGKS